MYTLKLQQTLSWIFSYIIVLLDTQWKSFGQASLAVMEVSNLKLLIFSSFLIITKQIAMQVISKHSSKTTGKNEL